MIGRHFNSMVESFQKLIEQVIESVDAMRQSCEELSRNAISASEGVSKQLNETDMVATAITEMGATIDEIAKNTELAAGKAEQTHHNAQEGRLVLRIPSARSSLWHSSWMTRPMWWQSLKKTVRP